jgi:serine/threonine-protein kinase
MDLSPRAVIAGRYRVDTKVGAGGMGEVWLGEHIAVGSRVAVKTLLPAAAMNHEVVARFKREAYILGRIRSDHVARVVDFVADDVYGLVLVMEFVEGDPLSRVLQERTLTVEEGIELAFGLATALKDLHSAAIIHRDLKPGNVMMRQLPDGRRRAVVVDFGVSRLMADKDKDEDEEITGITRADMAVGTIEYMAPEQILNSRNVTPGSDIYAAGAMLFRSCAGRHVFGNVQSDTELAQKKLTTEAPGLPLGRTDALAEGFAKLVGRMVKRRPSERYKTADEVLADLVPLRAAPSAISEIDSTTVDAPPGRSVMVGVGGAPVAQAAAAPPAQPVASALAAPIAAAAPIPAATPAGDSSSVSALQTVRKHEPTRRGVPVIVTAALMGVALGGGVFFGPRILAMSGIDPGTGRAAASATAPPAAAATSASPTVASASAAVPASAAATTPPPEASATAQADAGATAATAIGDAGAATDAGAAPSKTALPASAAASDAGTPRLAPSSEPPPPNGN